MTGQSQQDQHDYVADVLRLFLELPETPRKANTNDKITAAGLYERGIQIATVESAFLLASVRRLGRSSDCPLECHIGFRPPPTNMRVLPALFWG